MKPPNGRAIAFAALLGFAAFGLFLCFAPSSLDRVPVVKLVIDEDIGGSGPALNQRRQAANHLGEQLDQADRESAHAVAIGLAVLDARFTAASERVPEFAEAVLGWSAQWRYVIDFVPLTRGDRHADFVRSKFAELIISPSALEETLHAAGAACERELDAVDNRFLVAARADLEGLGVTTDRIERSLVSGARVDVLAGDLAKTAERFSKIQTVVDAGSIAAGEFVAYGAGKFWIGKAATGSGAVGAAPSLGATLAAGILVDILISKVIDATIDPGGAVAAEVNARLDDLERDVRAALTESMRTTVRQRIQARRRAIAAVVE